MSPGMYFFHLFRLMEFPYEEDVLTKIEDVSGRFSYRFVLDVNGLDAQCRTALYLAVANSYYDIVKYLLEVSMTLGVVWYLYVHLIICTIIRKTFGEEINCIMKFVLF